MRPQHTLELPPSNTIVDTPRVQTLLQPTLLRLVRHTTAMVTRGISAGSKTHTSYNNQPARTSRREVATQSIVHLLVRHQERREEMQLSGDGFYGEALLHGLRRQIICTGFDRRWDIGMRIQGQRAFSTRKLSMDRPFTCYIRTCVVGRT